MILTRKQMDEFKCSDPNCKDPSHKLIMHSKCHINFPTLAFITEELLELQCAKCNKLLFWVGIELGYGNNVNMEEIECQEEFCKKKHFMVNPKCHDAPVWAVYVKKTGVLELICAECQKLVYSISVKKE